MIKFSFILPIYNVERYLDECINSLLSQTYSNFEIILVDDGSPDNSPQKCDEWAVKESRIKVLHKVNGGLSDARNAGLAIATGDYIIFVDSDDFWVDKQGLEYLVDLLNKNPNCDFINFNCSSYFSNTNKYQKWNAYDEKLCIPIRNSEALHFLVTSGTIPMSAWMKVISRKSLININLSFIKGIHAEDIPWFIDLLDKTNQCMFTNRYIYAYRQDREGSITNTAGERSFNSLLFIVQRELDKIASRTFSKEAKNDLLSFLAYEVCIMLALLNSLPVSVRKEKRRELNKLKWLLDYTSNPKVKKAALVNKFFGFRVTEWVLSFYLNRVKK